MCGSAGLFLVLISTELCGFRVRRAPQAERVTLVSFSTFCFHLTPPPARTGRTGTDLLFCYRTWFRLNRTPVGSVRNASSHRGSDKAHLSTCPHSFSTDDDNDTEVETVEVDTELNLVTECWVEPQSGIVTDCMDQQRHFQGLTYQELPHAVCILLILSSGVSETVYIEEVSSFRSDLLCSRSSPETWLVCPQWWPLSIWSSCVRIRTRSSRCLLDSRMCKVTKLETHKNKM